MLPTTNVPADAPSEPLLKVLLADDNEVLLIAVRRLIERLGHSVDVARNGLEAITLASQKRFDCIFLDIQMPGMDGYATALALRDDSLNARGPCIVGLSGGVEDRTLREAAGMDEFLEKPARLSDLTRILQSLPTR